MPSFDTARHHLPTSAFLHALLVFVAWLSYFCLNLDFMPAAVWTPLAWLWLAWPLILVLTHAPRRSSLIACSLGILLILPTTPMVWFCTSVYLFGFAP